MRWLFSRTICAMTLLRDFYSQTHTQPCPLGVYTNPPPPVPLFLLPLNQYPKEIAESDITNCLTHTMYAISFKAKLCRPWKFELILSRAETYHVFLKTILLEYCCCVLCERMGNYAILCGISQSRPERTERANLKDGGTDWEEAWQCGWMYSTQV